MSRSTGIIGLDPSPSPPSYGERVGVRGCFRNHGESRTRGESPSPGSLRDPTSPRKRGEVIQSPRNARVGNGLLEQRVHGVGNALRGADLEIKPRRGTGQ